jgi:histidyl-tRNA synthetase
MTTIDTNSSYKGTHIYLGNEKRESLNKMIDHLKKEGFVEISIPIIQFQETFKDKVGEENNNLMFNFKDRGDRDLCLAPEYTSVVQPLAQTYFKHKKDVKLFYVQQCFRGEKPQKGRYREFTQLGVEILNPTEDYDYYLQCIAYQLICQVRTDIKVNTNVTRGLNYYTENKGFEIVCENLGSSKQICGGGPYMDGIGFAIGMDRLLSGNK